MLFFFLGLCLINDIFHGGEKYTGAMYSFFFFFYIVGEYAFMCAFFVAVHSEGFSTAENSDFGYRSVIKKTDLLHAWSFSIRSLHTHTMFFVLLHRKLKYIHAKRHTRALSG